MVLFVLYIMCFLKVKADEEGVELSLSPVYIYVLYSLSNTRVYVQYNSAIRYELQTVEYNIPYVQKKH